MSLVIWFLICTIHFKQLDSCIEMWSGNRCKAFYSCYHHIVGTAGAVDHKQVAVRVPAAYNADVGVIRVKYEIAGKRFTPGDFRAIAVLHMRAAAVSDYIRSICGVIKHPVYETGAVQTIRAVSSGRRASLRRHFSKLPPPGIPA